MARKRTYTRAFKLQALDLAKSGQKSISEIERDLGITPGLLHKWKARLKVDRQQAFPGKGRQKEDEELIRRLKRENELLRQEREILKHIMRSSVRFTAARRGGQQLETSGPKMGAWHRWLLTRGSCC